MLETMHAYEGVGLAAPQVGRSQRLFVLQEPDGEEMCLVNPEILGREGGEEGEEGCLSMPTIYTMVSRATRIRVQARDVRGKPLELEATDFLARIIQHEYDHLEGIMFPQRVDIITRQSLLEEWAEVRERMMNRTEELQGN
ncbi:MAG: peptide deformylase, partial [Candidatus Hydrogenedentes bacterium]|nr:peptide deformylase [Candidatus Hydrogenedentota bacterium]